MKLIIAIIKPYKLADVRLVLHRIDGLTGASFSKIEGFGRGHVTEALDNVAFEMADYLRLEIACQDDLVDEIVSSIEKYAHTGLRGDGKIYVTGIDQAVRIGTGERDENAV